ncbi:hypothetical protein [Hydrogenophaga sp. 2FB]|uniref:hypothetical protein n=1 Tax=Hydrogenophaga sp. 2FB TaxID=2502187 RepID=UPI0010F94065|nr:hypothetical protein [Hydrogenophaga sp. 2FB]
MSQVSKDPSTCLSELRQSGLQLCLLLERKSDLDAAERNALFETIGQISYISDGISLAMCVSGPMDIPDFTALIENADKLNSMVGSLLAEEVAVH